jgi:hypothetical protein
MIRSRDLGIDLASGREGELFKWFLACLLFGKPIQQQVAKRAYEELVAAGLATPRAILDAGWDCLVEVLDRGHYVRFDFSTATKLLEVCRALLEQYGTVSEMFRRSGSRGELSRRLQAFKGVGPTTARIFLRDTGFPPGGRRGPRAGRARRVVALLAGAALGVQGCAGTAWPRGAWAKPGVEREQQRRDQYECERRAVAGRARPGGEAAVYGQCMRERGYQPVPDRPERTSRGVPWSSRTGRG